MNKWDKRHLKNILVYLNDIDKLFDKAAAEVADIARLIGDLGDDTFSFSSSPLALSRINEIVADLKSRIEQTVTSGVRAEWELSNDKNDALCDLFLGEAKAVKDGDGLLEYYSRNEEELGRLLSRKTNGRTLSKRVWDITDGFKDEMEMALGVGIREGKSADRLSRDIRGYLREPLKLFRRVRDEQGQLRLSKNAKAYHPGRGVYRSSYMNARRLTATETNIAYRTADHLRWQQLDFVVGIRICLSNNHNCKGVPRGAFHDICDDLQGKYPKEFKFTGWHPFCRCYAVPILRNQAELDAHNDFIKDSDKAKTGDDLEVREMPKQFNDWVEKNKERIDRAKEKGTLPYFVKDNESLVYRNNQRIFDSSLPNDNKLIIKDEYVNKNRNEIESYLRKLASDKKEEEAFILFPDGRILHRCCESMNSVNLSGIDLEGTDILHNHPSKDGINEFDILLAYRKSANSITAICQDYKDTVYFGNASRLEIKNTDEFCNDIILQAVKNMNSIEYDRFRIGGQYSLCQLICKRLNSTLKREYFQK